LSVTLLTAGLMTLVVVLARDAAASWVLVAFATALIVGLIGWVRYWVGPVARQRAAIVAILLLGIYSVAQGVAGQRRKTEIRSEAQRRFGKDAIWAALTEVGKPFTWEAIYASTDTVAGEDWRLPRNLRLAVVRRAVSETPDGRAMAEFARFLAAEVDTTGKTVYLRDARYARTGRDGWGVVRVRME